MKAKITVDEEREIVYIKMPCGIEYTIMARGDSELKINSDFGLFTVVPTGNSNVSIVKREKDIYRP